MRQETINESGISIDLTILQDRASKHWLVMARWLTAKEELSTQTMPPLSPALTAEEAWEEARNWAERACSSTG